MKLAEGLLGLQVLLVLPVVEEVRGVPHAEGWQNMEQQGQTRGEIVESQSLYDKKGKDETA